MTHRDEQWAHDNFAQKYRVATGGPAGEVEQQVIGAVWGANGYTTRDQADLLGDRLELSPASRLLDVGAGRGWPGLYLASRHGCRVALTDLPYEGLAIAMTSARERGIVKLATAATASARDLPFRAASFDAVVHTDVLC
jgi:2-polyprenyl-3-methyl-5-hydroxy-6-metoxy-1,4-benzoquinol methylase